MTITPDTAPQTPAGGDAAEWAGLEAPGRFTTAAGTLVQRLIGYLRDCATATQRTLLVRNIFDGDAKVLPLGVDQLDSVIDGLRLTGRDAVDLAVGNQLNPSEKPLLLGALFVTGRYTRPTSKTPTRYCAPLLTASVTQEQDPTSATFTLAGDVGLNLALLADLLNTGEDEEEGLLHRLEGLLDFVPDLPFDPGDVAGFCEGLSTLLDLPVTVHHPVGLDPTIDLPEAHAEPRQGLELIGAAALFIGKDASELSVIRELEAIAEQDAEDSTLAAVLDPQASTHTGD